MINYHGGMSSTEISQRLSIALRLAEEAAKGIMHHFEKWADRDAIGLERKRDGSHVTRADREAEQLIRDLLARECPDDAVLGEELGEREGRSGYRWIVDPIDGTASFVCGVPLFGTLIGVEHQGRCVAGVIHLPAMRETVFGGPGLGATHRRDYGDGLYIDKPAHVSGVRELADAVLVTTSIDYYRRGGYESLYSRCSSVVNMTRGWSDAYGFLLVATGRADVIVEPLVKAWDVAAIYPVIEAAGGVSRDFEGGQDIHAGHVVSGNEALVRAMGVMIREGVK